MKSSVSIFPVLMWFVYWEEGRWPEHRQYYSQSMPAIYNLNFQRFGTMVHLEGYRRID